MLGEIDYLFCTVLYIGYIQTFEVKKSQFKQRTIMPITKQH